MKNNWVNNIKKLGAISSTALGTLFIVGVVVAFWGAVSGLGALVASVTTNHFGCPVTMWMLPVTFATGPRMPCNFEIGSMFIVFVFYLGVSVAMVFATFTLVCMLVHGIGEKVWSWFDGTNNQMEMENGK